MRIIFSLKILIIVGLLFNLMSCESNVISESKTKVDEVDSLLKVADSYHSVNIDSMLILSVSASKLAKQYGYEVGYLEGVLQQGIALFYKGEDSMALAEIKKIEQSKLNEGKATELIIAKKNSLKGSIYHNKDLYDSAAVYMFEALHIFEKQGDNAGIAKVSANLSTNYIMTEDYEKALEFIQKAASIFVQTKNKEGQAAVYERQGSIYAHQEKYDSALVYFERSLKMAQEINHVFFMANGLHNIGSVYMKQNKYELGQSYLEKAAAAFKKVNNQLGYAMTINNLARMEFDRNDNQRAFENYQIVNQIALENDFLQLQADSYQYLSIILERRKQYEAALKYRLFYEEIRDSLNKTERIKTIKTLENKYLNSQKDKVILNQQLKIQKDKTRLLYGVLIFLIIVLGLTFLIYKRRNENKQLVEKNELIKAQQKELRHRTANQLEQLSDLFAIYGLMKQDDNDVLKEAKSRVEAINSVYESLENSRTNEIDIKPFLENIIQKILIIYGVNLTDIQLKLTIFDTTMAANKALFIGQLTNEVLNNTLKHAFDKIDNSSKIEVTLVEVNQTQLRLTIKDNGKGFEPMKAIHQDRMGLSLIRTFVKAIRGELTMQTDDHGTEYCIVFEK